MILPFDKTVAQPQLRAELAAAGIADAVVQVIEHGEWNEAAEWVESAPPSVEVVVDDDADSALIGKVVADHAPAEPVVEAVQTLEERATAALENLPPDRVVTASELLAIIRGTDA